MPSTGRVPERPLVPTPADAAEKMEVTRSWGFLQVTYLTKLLKLRDRTGPLDMRPGGGGELEKQWLLRYALSPRHAAPLLQLRSCATTRLGSSPRLGKTAASVVPNQRRAQ